MNNEQIIITLITFFSVVISVMFVHRKQKRIINDQISAFHKLDNVMLYTYEFVSPTVKKYAYSKLYGIQIAREIEKKLDEINFNLKSHFVEKTLNYNLNSLGLFGYDNTQLSKQEIRKIQLVNLTDYKLALSSKVDQIAEERDSILTREIEYVLILKSKFDRMMVSSSQKDYSYFNEDEKAITKDLSNALLTLLKELDQSALLDAINLEFDNKTLKEELQNEK